MGGWGYRVLLRNGDYAVYDVFYNDRDEIWACSEDPVNPQGDSLEALEEDLKFFMDALELPVVRYEDLPEGEPDPAIIEAFRKARTAVEVHQERESLKGEELPGGS